MRSAARTALLGLLLLLIAALFDGEPLYVAGVAFAVLGAGAAAWVSLAARGAWIERTVERPTVVEDEPLVVRIVAHAGALPLPGGRIEEDLLPEPAAVRPGRRRVRLRVAVTFAHRGRRALPAPRLLVSDPLGLATRSVAAPRDDSVLVLPKTSPVHAPAGWGAGVVGRSRAALGVAAEVEVDGLRPHQPGTPASRIHWPSVARGHPMMERRLRAELDSRPLVVLDARGPADGALDSAVRAAASLAIALARAGGCALLLPGERRPTVLAGDLGAWPAAHVRLALVAAGTAPAPAAMGARSGPVFYVAARVPRELPRALREGAGERVLVVPDALARRQAAFSVAGCRGYSVARARRALGAA
jgi:uncharacterized protein (DUF58 family)